MNQNCTTAISVKIVSHKYAVPDNCKKGRLIEQNALPVSLLICKRVAGGMILLGEPDLARGP